MISVVDTKIKKSLIRAENPIQGNNRIERQQIEQASLLQNKNIEDISSFTKDDRIRFDRARVTDLSDQQRDQLYQEIDRLKVKYELFNTTAQAQAEEGNFEEHEKILAEAQKFQVKIEDIEAVLRGEAPHLA
mmetsp:Transcript_5725/g.9096  ORF Transcript_5725/g.9096 Transcript_5725/m.9096 type:complete len:132 (-) Transcript_5725:700-1095(-)